MDLRLERKDNKELVVIRSSSCVIKICETSSVFKSCHSDTSASLSQETCVFQEAKPRKNVYKNPETIPQRKRRHCYSVEDAVVERSPARASDGNERNDSSIEEVESPSQLPKDVLQLIAPSVRDVVHAHSSHHINEHDMLKILIQVLNELKLDCKNIFGKHDLCDSRDENAVKLIIRECFTEIMVRYSTESSYSTHSSSSSRGNSYNRCQKIISRSIKGLTLECVDIIEKAICKQAKVMRDNREGRESTKSLLVKLMQIIQTELNISKPVLKVVKTELHQPSFQFIFELLKYFIEKSAIGFKKFCRKSKKNLSNLTRRIKSAGEVSGNSCKVSISAADQKLEEYANRLDRLLEKVSSEPPLPENPQLVIECYHCTTKCKEQDLLLKTVTRFTEEIKQELINHAGVVNEGSHYSYIRNGKGNNSKEVSVCSPDISTLQSHAGAFQRGFRSERSSSMSPSTSPVRNMSQQPGHMPRPNDSRSKNQMVPAHQHSTICDARQNSRVHRLTHNALPNEVSTQEYIFCAQHAKEPVIPKTDSKSCTKFEQSRGMNSRAASPSSLHHHKTSDFESSSAPKSSPVSRGEKYNTCTSQHGDDSRTKQESVNKCRYCTSHTGNNSCAYDAIKIEDAAKKVIGNGSIQTYEISQDRLPKPPLLEKSRVNTIPEPNKKNGHKIIPKEDQGLVRKGKSGNEDQAKANGKSMQQDNSKQDVQSVKDDKPSNDNTKDLQSKDKGKSKIKTPDENATIKSESPKKEGKDRSKGAEKTKQEKKVSLVSLPKDHSTAKLKTSDPTMEKKMNNTHGNDKQKVVDPGETGKELKPVPENVEPKKVDETLPRAGMKGADQESSNTKDPAHCCQTNCNCRNRRGEAQVKNSDNPPKRDSMNQTDQVDETLPGAGMKGADQEISKTKDPAHCCQMNCNCRNRRGEAQVKKSDNPPRRDSMNQTDQEQQNPPPQNTNCCKGCNCGQNSIPVFMNGCTCKPGSSQEGDMAGRPIYQFFANPVPVPCKCEKTSQTKEQKESQTSKPATPKSARRESQETGTQTSKNQLKKAPPEPSSSAMSSPKSAPSSSAPSYATSTGPPGYTTSSSSEPTYLKSSTTQPTSSTISRAGKSDSMVSCTCSMDKQPPQSTDTESSKPKMGDVCTSDTNCCCPEKIEEVFQEFDDKYSEVVKEIKFLIREGYIPLNKQETRELTVTASRSSPKGTSSKTATCRCTADSCKRCRGNPAAAFSRDPHQSNRQGSRPEFSKNDRSNHDVDECEEGFQSGNYKYPKKQIKYDSDAYDECETPPSPPPYASRDTFIYNELQKDIHDLKELVKNTRLGNCPCCKCCKCEPESQGKPFPPSTDGRHSTSPQDGANNTSKPAPGTTAGKDSKQQKNMPSNQPENKSVPPVGQAKSNEPANKDQPGEPTYFGTAPASALKRMTNPRPEEEQEEGSAKRPLPKNDPIKKRDYVKVENQLERSISPEDVNKEKEKIERKNGKRLSNGIQQYIAEGKGKPQDPAPKYPVSSQDAENDDSKGPELTDPAPNTNGIQQYIAEGKDKPQGPAPKYPASSQDAENYDSKGPELTAPAPNKNGIQQYIAEGKDKPQGPAPKYPASSQDAENDDSKGPELTDPAPNKHGIQQYIAEGKDKPQGPAPKYPVSSQDAENKYSKGPELTAKNDKPVGETRLRRISQNEKESSDPSGNVGSSRSEDPLRLKDKNDKPIGETRLRRISQNEKESNDPSGNKGLTNSEDPLKLTDKNDKPVGQTRLRRISQNEKESSDPSGNKGSSGSEDPLKGTDVLVPTKASDVEGSTSANVGPMPASTSTRRKSPENTIGSDSPTSSTRRKVHENPIGSDSSAQGKRVNEANPADSAERRLSLTQDSVQSSKTILKEVSKDKVESKTTPKKVEIDEPPAKPSTSTGGRSDGFSDVHGSMTGENAFGEMRKPPPTGSELLPQKSVSIVSFGSKKSARSTTSSRNLVLSPEQDALFQSRERLRDYSSHVFLSPADSDQRTGRDATERQYAVTEEPGTPAGTTGDDEPGFSRRTFGRNAKTTTTPTEDDVSTSDDSNGDSSGESSGDSSGDSAVDICRTLLDMDPMPCRFWSNDKTTPASQDVDTYIMVLETETSDDLATRDETFIISDNKPTRSINKAQNEIIDKRKLKKGKELEKSINGSLIQQTEFLASKGTSTIWKGITSPLGVMRSIFKTSSPPIAPTSTELSNEINERELPEKIIQKPAKKLVSPLNVSSHYSHVSIKMPRSRNHKSGSGGDLRAYSSEYFNRSSAKPCKTKDKEVQVTKWNAMTQTAGPRKFNRTDISKDIEDKLARYLGLKRTIEDVSFSLTVSSSSENQQTVKKGSTRKSNSPNKHERNCKKTTRSKK